MRQFFAVDIRDISSIEIIFDYKKKGKDVSISPGPIALLSELATSLSGRRTTVCLEHNEA